MQELVALGPDRRIMLEGPVLLRLLLHAASASASAAAADPVGRAAAWSGAWNASADFKTGLSLVVLSGLELSSAPPESAMPAAPPAVSVARLWSGVVAHDSLTAPSSSRISSRLWHPNVYLGVEYDTSFEVSTAVLSQTATALSLQRSVRLGTQQGWVTTNETHSFEVLGGDRLRYTMHSDRPNATTTFDFLRPAAAAAAASKPGLSAPLAEVNARPAVEKPAAAAAAYDIMAHQSTPENSTATGGVDMAYNVALNDTWSIADGGVDENLLLLSLQGLANRGQRRLYLTYPTSWAYSYTGSVREWVEETYLPLTELSSASEALHTFRGLVKGYVVFDPAVRESIAVGLTAAGVMDAALISPALVPLAKAAGLPCALDLRDRFVGWSAVRIYTWAREQFFDKCSNHVMVWLGGVCGNYIHPAIADWGVSQRAFFTDLDTRPDVPAAKEEYDLADSLVASLDVTLPTPPLVMGWHTYCKDFEHTFASLASRHGGRVHGLNTNPNLSFMHELPLPANFTFRNNRPNVPVTDRRGADQGAATADSAADGTASMYVTLVQTDGLGLGAWNKPGRGALPYAWEVTLPDLEIQPALLAMFYSQATANDTFVAALSGPGYVYPKAAGAHLPRLLALADESMAALDLDVMVVFDASNSSGSSSALGDTTLPEAVVAEYSRCLPNATGFLNGYGPSFTASPNDGHAFLSFDYYLDEQRPTEAVAVRNRALSPLAFPVFYLFIPSVLANDRFHIDMRKLKTKWVSLSQEDLANLADLNARMPYLLAIHVREYSNVNKVAGILSELKGAQVLPVHEFVALANEHATYRTRYGPTGPGQY